MELTNEIKEILENVVYWETCPQDYKDKINAYLKSENESEALSIHNVSKSSYCDDCGDWIGQGCDNNDCEYKKIDVC